MECPRRSSIGTSKRMDSSPLVATQKEEEGRSEVKVIEEDLGVDHHEVAREEDLMVALLVAEAVEEDRVAAEGRDDIL